MTGDRVAEGLRYTEQHEWVAGTEEGTVRIGVTDYAQHQLGDVVFVGLPAVGTRVGPGETALEVESTKSVSDVYAPLAGEVVAVNGALETGPEVVNSDPYGAGWMIELRPDDPSAMAALLDAASYRAVLERG